MSINERIEWPTVDRAVREHAPAALRAAGLRTHAAHLEALREVVDWRTAQAAAQAAGVAWGDALRAASRAAPHAIRAASAAQAAAWEAADRGRG